ncbi:MAG: hypothetical protein HFF73_01095 [Oscillospiraceae bacterium]|nr:hypothetical protein [Oscillospiraceae bacterium]
MLMMISGLLICCSLLRTVILTPMTCSENLSCPEPKIRGSQLNERNGLELPYYTAGFE